MMLWLVFALLAGLIGATVFLPLARLRAVAPSRLRFDRAIYRDQLAEIERDRVRGVLSEGESAAARLEVQRRLLATISTREAPASMPNLSSRGHRPLAAALTLLVPLCALGVYLLHGAPQLPDQPYWARAAERALVGGNGRGVDLEQAADALRAKLRDDAGDGDGWLLLARTEAALGHWQRSAAAYHQALALTRQRPDIAAAYGEMLVLAADGVVTPAAHDAFAAALAREPKNPSARFYMGLALAQSGDPQAAITAWQQLLAEAPADAPYAALVRQRMAETAAAAGLPTPATVTAPGPGAADIAAAGSMTPEQRAKMIEGMVDRLAQRLQAEPDDLQGWLRLARAYNVLNQNDKAADAFAHAAALKPDDADILGEEIEALMAHRPPSEAIPESTRALLAKLEALDANNPRALWYLGLAAAQDRRFDEAKAHWQRLLGLLPADSEEHGMVAAAIAALQGK